MKQENRELLLEDISSRLPYGVKMNHIANSDNEPTTLIGIVKNMITLEGNGGYSTVNIDEFKPYLFPLSSMTDEQRKYIDDRWGINEYFDFEVDPYWGKHFVELGDVIEYVNWLIENHFDFNGLIPKGLAIDATGLNIY